MKKILTILLLTNLTMWNGYAQKFPLDASGEIVYQEIVEVDSLIKDVGYRNGLKWLSALKDEHVVLTKKDSIEGTLAGLSTFSVYEQSGAFKKLSGKISYAVIVNVKDGKYRYSISDLVFHYYKQNRTYNMVETGKTKKLEEADAKGWQKLWTKHRIAANDELNRNIGTLKVIMKEKPATGMDKAPTKKIEW